VSSMLRAEWPADGRRSRYAYTTNDTIVYVAIGACENTLRGTETRLITSGIIGSEITAAKRSRDDGTTR